MPAGRDARPRSLLTKPLQRWRGGKDCKLGSAVRSSALEPHARSQARVLLSAHRGRARVALARACLHARRPSCAGLPEHLRAAALVQAQLQLDRERSEAMKAAHRDAARKPSVRTFIDIVRWGRERVRCARARCASRPAACCRAR